MLSITKPFWSRELPNLKRLSIEAHAIRSSQGRPRAGVINDNRLLCKSKYKKASHVARVTFAHSLTNKLTNKLLGGDTKAFWAK